MVAALSADSEIGDYVLFCSERICLGMKHHDLAFKDDLPTNARMVWRPASHPCKYAVAQFAVPLVVFGDGPLEADHPGIVTSQ